jgi:hypothetical protein
MLNRKNKSTHNLGEQKYQEKIYIFIITVKELSKRRNEVEKFLERD